MESVLKLLLVEDNPGDADLIIELLSETKLKKSIIQQAGNLKVALAMLNKDTFDIVLLDLGLPDSSGLNGLVKTIEINPNIPIVVVSGLDDLKIGEEAIQQGAEDYLIKGKIDDEILTRVVLYSIERKKQKRELKTVNQQLQASEQQLQAANQQLKATNQQLIASEQEIRESEENYRLIFESTGTATLIVDEHTTILQANNECGRVTGYSPLELVGTSWTNYVYKEDLPEMLENAKARIKDPSMIPNKYESRLINASEEIRNAIISIGFITESKRSIVSMIDITEHKQAEKKLKLSEDRLREAQRIANIGNWHLNLETGEVFLSDEMHRIMGISEEDRFKDVASHEKYYTPESWQVFQEAVEKARTTGKSYEIEMEFVSSENKTRYAIARGEALLDENKKAIGLQGTLQDITERKQTEEQVRQSALKWQSTFNSITDILTVISKDHEFLEINQAGCEALGLEHDDIIGKKCFEIMHGTESPIKECPCVCVFESKKMEVSEYTQNGRHCLLTAWPIMDEDGNVASFSHSIKDITERKQAEAELIKLSTAIQQSPSVIAISDTTGKLEYVNPQFTESTGYDMEEAIGQNSRVLKSGEQSDKFYKELWETISAGNTWRGEFHNKKKNGELYWEQASVSPIFDEQGKIVNYIKVAEDITKRKQAEDNFRHSIDESPLGIRIVNQAGKTIYVNKALLDIYEISSPDEFLNTAAIETYTEQSYQEHQERKEIRQQGGDTSDYEISIRRKNGEIRHIKVWRKEVIWNREKHFQVINQDITELKQLNTDLILAKEKAEENERMQIAQKKEIILNNNRLESLLKISQFQTKSIQELLDYALEEAIKLTESKIGYIYFYNETTRQFILNTWSDRVMDECKVVNPQTVYDLDKTGCWGEAVRQRKPIVLNNYHEANPIKKVTPKGHVQLEKFLTIPVIIEDKIVAVAGVANKERDYNNADIRQLNLQLDSVWKISERISLIENLEIAKEKAEESNRLKTAFLNNMSHEIRTPLNGITGFIGLLQDPEIDDEQKQHYFDIINKSSDRLIATVTDIIDISRIEAGQVEVYKTEVSVNKLLDEQFNFFRQEAESKGLKLSCNRSLSDSEAHFVTDKFKLEGILTNLIKNAIKFTDQGEISLACWLKKEQDMDVLEFCVKDTGIGIPANRIEAIFNRFEQADIEDTRVFQGSGLGLAIAKSYIEMLGGEISVSSEVGKGSTFTFSLPYTKQFAKESDDNDNINKETQTALSNLSVIIAEDDEVNIMYFDAIFKNEFDKITYTKTGKEIIDKCKENPETDLILMDIKMPGMNGYDATREIRKFNSDVIIIAQTAFGLSGDREKAIEAGCNDYISKPINKAELKTLIQKYFEE